MQVASLLEVGCSSPEISLGQESSFHYYSEGRKGKGYMAGIKVAGSDTNTNTHRESENY